MLNVLVFLSVLELYFGYFVCIYFKLELIGFLFLLKLIFLGSLIGRFLSFLGIMLYFV